MECLKKLLIYGMLFLMVLIFCSCGSERIDEDEAAENLVNQVFEYFNDKDSEGLKALFSKNVIESYDLDKEIENFFNFLEGNIISYDAFDSGWSSEKIRYGKQIFLTISPEIKNVKTDVGNIYEIRIYAYIVCEEDEDKVGIDSIRVVVDNEVKCLVGDP